MSAATVRAALVATLQSIDATGSYTLDLSASTHEGIPPAGRPAGQVAYVYRGEGTYTRDPEASLGGWMRTGRWGITLYATSDSTSGADRETLLDTMESDIMDALDASLLSGGALGAAGVIDVQQVEMRPIFGTQPGAQSHPVALDLVVTLAFIRGR
jgi:hypothetical protein